MPALRLNKVVEQTSPRLTVTNRLKPGKYRFRLSVLDNAGNESKPTELTVTVAKPGDVGPDLRPILDPRLRINPDPLRDRIIRR